MPLSQTELETILADAFPDATIEVKDLAGDNDHYSATVTSPVFEGQSRIIQHKMVYAALKGTKAEDVHALQLKTGAS